MGMERNGTLEHWTGQKHPFRTIQMLLGLACLGTHWEGRRRGLDIIGPAEI